MKKYDILVQTKIGYLDVKAKNKKEAFNKVEKMFIKDFRFTNHSESEMEIVNINN